MPSKTKGLIATLKSFHVALAELIERLKRLDSLLAEALKAALITKKIVGLLTDVEALLDAVHAALMVLAEVPYVNVVAKPLKEIVGKMKDRVRSFKEQVQRLEDSIEPLRERAQSAREALKELITPLLALDEFVSQDLVQLERAEAAASALPEGRYKRAQEAQLEQLSTKLAEILGVHRASLDRARAAVDAIEPALKSMMERCEGLLECAKLITDLIGDVEEVAKDAKSLDDTLNQKIHFGGRQVSIKSVLESALKIPEELMKPVMKVLAEPLRELQQGMGLKLPDPIQVVLAFQAIQRQLSAVTTSIDASNPRLKDLADRGGMPKAFSAIAP